MGMAARIGGGTGGGRRLHGDKCMSVVDHSLPVVLVGGVTKALIIMGVRSLSGIGEAEEGQLIERANLGNI